MEVCAHLSWQDTEKLTSEARDMLSDLLAEVEERDRQRRYQVAMPCTTHTHMRVRRHVRTARK